jgi:hypothetical protein
MDQSAATLLTSFVAMHRKGGGERMTLEAFICTLAMKYTISRIGHSGWAVVLAAVDGSSLGGIGRARGAQTEFPLSRQAKKLGVKDWARDHLR